MLTENDRITREILDCIDALITVLKPPNPKGTKIKMYYAVIVRFPEERIKLHKELTRYCKKMLEDHKKNKVIDNEYKA